jgi:DNA-binding NarL/FixJ family response regulator
MERKLNPTEKERIETHTYYTDKILSRSKLLTPYIEYCISHHETLKGTGYHRRLKELNLSQSILIYSDKVIALGSERSHRKAYSNKEILEILKLEIQEGKLEKKIYPYIEEYLGFKNKINKLSQNIFALTEREIEVLRYISEGYTNKQIAKKLNISDRTVQHHSIHIYEKMGVRTRSAAVMLGYKEKILQV